MVEDYWLHAYFDDPKAVTNTVEDDEFDPDNVAEELASFRRDPARVAQAEERFRRQRDERRHHNPGDDFPDDFEPVR